MIREGVDARIIESLSPNIAAYNLAVSGDLPYRRMVELPLAIAVRPDRVVIGLSYPEVFENRMPFEDQIAVLPAAAYEKMPAEAKRLLAPEFLKIARRSKWERFWWERKFFFSAAFWRLGIPDRANPLKPGYTTELKAPWVYEKSLRLSELERFLNQRQNRYPPYSENKRIELGTILPARGLELIVNHLQAQGIRVSLVNMPLHPLLNDIIPPERHRLLRDYLESLATGSVTFIDFQDKLGAGDFIDLVHLNDAGRNAFTRAMLPSLSTNDPVAGETRPAGNTSISVSSHAF
jgi:hypothetical protein